MYNLLSILILLPLLASVLLLFVPSQSSKIFKIVTLAVSTFQLGLVGVIYAIFEKKIMITSDASYWIELFQMVEKREWLRLDFGKLGSLSVEYFVGIDGLGLMMLMLSVLVLWIGAVASWHIQQKVKGYFILYLVLNGAVVGCFVALDFFLFYVFFEFMLLPMYFLIGIWGGEKREYAAIKFFIYTLVGSLLILLVMIVLHLSVIDPIKTVLKANLAQNLSEISYQDYQKAQQLRKENTISSAQEVHTFNILMMYDQRNYQTNSKSDIEKPSSKHATERYGWLFWALLIGFAIKLPIVPLHTWLPDAHVEAPTAISVVLAGVLLKIGGYGILRIGLGIFPFEMQQNAWWIGLIGVISILYGGMNALAMQDLKKMIAYSSVSHMGFVLVGIASLSEEGINGAIFQMVSHGILSSMLFVIAGILYDRTHNRMIDNYRGLIHPLPHYSVWVMIAFFASLGLPGFSAFIGELFAIMGIFTSSKLPTWMGLGAAFGIVLSAAYFLWTYQKMFLGEFWVRKNVINPELLIDINLREKMLLMILGILSFILGIFPHFLFQMLSQTVGIWLNIR